MPYEDEIGRPVNPYAAPASIDYDAHEPADDDAQTAELRAFVGSKANYYLGKWQGLLGGDNHSAGFNWAAFLLSGMWLSYRKMYRVALILLGVTLVESLCEQILFVGLLGYPDVPRPLELAVTFAVAGICGGFGNRWYLSHAKGVIASVDARNLPPEVTLAEISSRGGASFLAMIGFCVVLIATNIVAFMLLDLLWFGP